MHSASLTASAWIKFRKNKLGLFGLGFILLICLIAIFGYWIAPDGSPDADTHINEIGIMKPGSRCTQLAIRKNNEPKKSNLLLKLFVGEPNSMEYHAISNYWFEGQNFFYQEYAEAATGGKIWKLNLADVVYALDKNQPVKHDSIRQTIEFSILGEEDRLVCSYSELRKAIMDQITQRTFYFGTDQHGRDVLSRVLIGARISLFVGLIAVFISLGIGLLLGALAGFFRGWVDNLIMWLINVIWSIPTLLFVIAIALALGKGMLPVFVAVGLTMWVETARVVRGQILSIREKEFVEAGRALGFSNRRIIFRHVLPNVIGPVIVITAHNFASAILIEAGLSFLGIGTQRPTPSWGIMVSDYRGYILVGDYFLALIPGLAIMLLVMAFLFVGNGLRDALDTKMRDQDKLVA